MAGTKKWPKRIAIAFLPSVALLGWLSSAFSTTVCQQRVGKWLFVNVVGERPFFLVNAQDEQASAAFDSIGASYSSLPVDADEAGLPRGRVQGKIEPVQVLSVGGEFLQAGIVQIGDVDFVLLVDCDFDGRVELARLLSFLPPGQNEPGLVELTGLKYANNKLGR